MHPHGGRRQIDGLVNNESFEFNEVVNRIQGNHECRFFCDHLLGICNGGEVKYGRLNGTPHDTYIPEKYIERAEYERKSKRKNTKQERNRYY